LFRPCFAWLLVLATLPVLAEESADRLSPLTLPQGAERVLEQNPRLAAGHYRRDAAAAEIDAAALNPQWSLSLDVEDMLGTGIARGFDASQTTLSLSRIFRTSEFLDSRISVAAAQSTAVDNALEAERLDLMAVLAGRFLKVVYWQEQRALAGQAVTTWTHATGLARERERAGAASSVYRLQTEIRTERAKLALEDTEHELAAARTVLAATWGADGADFGPAAAELCTLADLASFDSLVEQIESNPDVLRFATEQRVLEAEGRLAEARNKPAWSLTAGVRHLAFSGDEAFVLGASVPLGGKKRAEPMVRQSNAQRQQSALEERQVRNDARATLYALYQEARHAAHEVEVYETEILPRADDILAEIKDGYRLGRFSHLELMNTQAELLAARAARLDACAEHHQFLIDIERLTGGGELRRELPAGDGR
jgi:outer membrane protein, heavy metal efflux system